MTWYVCDFETTVEDEPRVWEWEALSDEEKYTGTDIESYMLWLMSESRTVYFHNMKFDSSYILSWLFQHGWDHVWEKADRSFTTIISDMGQYYMVRLWKDDITVTIYDSYKIVSLSVHDIAGAYGLAESKGEIDYAMSRPPGYQPTAEEWD